MTPGPPPVVETGPSSATGSPPTPGSSARRAERWAIAVSLLEAPPPLEALRPRQVEVLDRVVVHASRSRPVVRWTVRVDSALRPARRLPVIGKGYRKGGGEAAWQLLARLRAAGLDHPVLQVPAPFGYDPARSLLTQEEAPPTTLKRWLADDPARTAPGVVRVGAWLARLHGVRGVDPPVLADGFERVKLAEYAGALAETLPWSGSRIADLTAGTLDRLAGAGGGRVLTHGDFQPGNIHADDSRVVVIDFDRAACAPAARDLGHFVGQTLTMGAARHGHLAAAAPWVEAFLRGYRAAGGDEAAVAGTPAYVARTFAEVLYYRLVVRPVADRSFVPDWLDAWEQALEERPW